jgi:hypothetical protein
MKLEVPPDDMTLTLWDAVTRRVQWRRTFINVDPSAAASALNTASQLNTTPASIFPETRSSLSPNREQLRPSPIREQLRPSPPQTRSTPAPDQLWPSVVMPKATKNACGKSQPQQRKISSKATKGKQRFKQMTAMMQANLKFVMGQPMLTADELDKVGQACKDLHKYYTQNYESSLGILGSYKDRHFLVGDDIFMITFSNLNDLFNLDALDISLMRSFTL